jgi:hypothetical protein
MTHSTTSLVESPPYKHTRTALSTSFSMAIRRDYKLTIPMPILHSFYLYLKAIFDASPSFTSKYPQHTKLNLKPTLHIHQISKV